MKKFKRNMLLAMGMFLSSVAVAQEGTVQKFPDFKMDLPVTYAADDIEGPEKVSPNAEKEKGVFLYATTLVDYFGKERGWYSMKALDTNNVKKIKTWAPGSGYAVDGLRCGSWAGDAYYAYFVREYDLGFDYPDSFVKVDVATGDTTVVKHFAAGDDFFDNWQSKYYLYYMTYDPVKDKIYALGRTTFEDGTQGASLYTVDKTTGLPTKVKDFDFISFAAAVDMEGKFWIHESVYSGDQYTGCKLVCMNTDDFSTISESYLKLYGRFFKTLYYGTMSFDYTTGDLYWGATDETYASYLYKVDKETGAMETLGALWGKYVGMYIPYVLPDEPDAPTAVVDLKATPDKEGNLKSTLTWKNPTLQWNKEPLTKLAEILIHRKGVEEPVATLSVSADQIGQEMSWVDENAEYGINSYYVTACSEVGVKGIKDSINVYVGEDAPGAVQNITLDYTDNVVTVSWEAPVEGLYEGYVDASAMTYSVVRYPDEKVIATDITELSVKDTDINELRCHFYAIQAKNSVGEGVVETSRSIVVGEAYSTPVSLNFTDSVSTELWTNLGGWAWTHGVGEGDERMETLVEESANNWLISPDFKLESGKRYKVTSIIRTDMGRLCRHDFKFALGQGKTAEDMTIVLRDVTDHWNEQTFLVEELVDYIDITEGGIYNYGINVTRNSGDVFSLIGLKVEEVYAVDMAALSISNIYEAIYNSDNTCTVNVRNNGSEAISDYKVKIARYVEDGNHVVLGESTEVPTVEPYADGVVTVTFRPDLEEDMQIVAIVEAEGDGNTADNTTEPYAITVLPEGMCSFNRRIINEETLGVWTRMPMSFYEDESTSQTIYLADEVNMANGGQIMRLAYEYKGNGITSVLGPFSVQIYMAHTDLDRFDTAEMIDINSMQLVFDGESTISPGENTMNFNFQEAFEYDGKRNICVAVVKNGSVGQYFPAQFSIFNDGAGTPRSILNDGDPMNISDIPVLQLAVVENGTGIEKDLTLGGSTIWYDAESATLNFSDDQVKDVYVYDISGKMVAYKNLGTPVSSLSMNLTTGLYIVQTVNAEGIVNRAKLNVLR